MAETTQGKNSNMQNRLPDSWNIKSDKINPGEEDKTPEQIVAMRIKQAIHSGKTSLDLSGLNLSQLPGNIGEITSLLELNISENKLTKLPNSLQRLENLTVLNIRLNPFTVFPLTILDCKKLQELIIGTGYPKKMLARQTDGTVVQLSPKTNEYPSTLAR